MNAHQNRFYNNELPLLLDVRRSSLQSLIILLLSLFLNRFRRWTVKCTTK